jgi:hypothetical protein
MSSIQKILIQKQIDELIQTFVSGKQNAQPSAGWIQSVQCKMYLKALQLADNGDFSQLTMFARS